MASSYGSIFHVGCMKCQTVSEYQQEMPHSHTTDQLKTEREREGEREREREREREGKVTAKPAKLERASRKTLQNKHSVGNT